MERNVSSTHAQGYRQSRLLDLPSELIDEILSHISPERDFEADPRIGFTSAEQERRRHNKRMRATLRTLCLVSKLMHRYAEPALYSWFIIRGNNEQAWLQIAAFLNRLISDSLLARQIKYFEFSYDEFDNKNWSIGRGGTIIPAALKVVLSSFMTGSKLFELEGLKLHVVIMALVALILARSANLQHLSISTTFRWPVNVHDILNIFGPNDTQPQCLSKLQVLCFTKDCKDSLSYACFADNFMDSLRTLPQLKHLQLRCIGKPSAMTDMKANTFDFLALRTIHLERFGDPPATFAKIINGCEGLQNITCVFLPLENVFTPPHGHPLSGPIKADCSAVDSALQKHRDSLETLKFCLNSDISFRQIVPLSTLSTLHKVRTLEIDTVSLLGAPWIADLSPEESRWWYENTPFRLVERLPPNIVELYLYNFHRFQDGVLVLRELAMDCHRLSRLKTVRKVNWASLKLTNFQIYMMTSTFRNRTSRGLRKASLRMVCFSCRTFGQNVWAERLGRSCAVLGTADKLTLSSIALTSPP
jgi:hypothetical protein